MIIFNCTQSATDFFTIKKGGEKISVVESPAHKTIDEAISNSALPKPSPRHWLLHVKKVARKNVLVAMDYETRFAICLTGVIKGNDPLFMQMFEHHLFVHVKVLMSSMYAREDMIDNSIERYVNTHQQVRFCRRGDRSMQRHINEAFWQFELATDDYIGHLPTGAELISVDDHINEMIKGRNNRKEYFIPKEDFLRRWLEYYTSVPSDKLPQLFNTLRKKKGYLVDDLPDLTLSNIESSDFISTSAKNNVISFADYKRAKKT